MANYFITTKINDFIYQFHDPIGVLSTLIIGKERALLLDTTYGIGDLKEHLQTFTSLPVIVINSHGHMDHTGGNYQFEEIYLHEDDILLCQAHNSPVFKQSNLDRAEKANVLPAYFDTNNYLKSGPGTLIPLKTDQVFDLGQITVKVLPLPGHTKGSIALLLPMQKILLTSDGACPFVWLFLEESTSVATYIHSLQNLLSYDFDNFLVGHGAGLLPRQKIGDFLKVAEKIDLSKSTPVSFDGFTEYNSYCFTEGKMYEPGGVGIIFDPDKLY